MDYLRVQQHLQQVALALVAACQCLAAADRGLVACERSVGASNVDRGWHLKLEWRWVLQGSPPFSHAAQPLRERGCLLAGR